MRLHRFTTLTATTAIALACTTLGACAQPAAPAPAAPAAPAPVAPATDSQTLYRQIRDEIGVPACSAHEQCRSTAVGHKACGGPEAYLVWSTTTSDGTRLRQLIDAYTRARTQEGQRSGMLSDCSLVPDTGARCEAGRCVPGQRGPAVM